MFGRMRIVASGLVSLVLIAGCDRDAPRSPHNDPPSPVVELESLGSDYSVHPPTPDWIRVRVEASDEIVTHVKFDVPDPRRLAEVAGYHPVRYELPAVQAIRSPMDLPTDTPPYTATMTIANPRSLDETMLRIFSVAEGETVLYEGTFRFSND